MKRTYYLLIVLLIGISAVLYLLKLTHFALYSGIANDALFSPLSPRPYTTPWRQWDGEADYVTGDSSECVDILENLYSLGPSELEANYHQGDVLLLHGAAYSSAIWLSINTIKVLSAQGFRTVAIDLPGYGKSAVLTDLTHKEKLIECVMEKFELDHPFLVAPSMSGQYAIPYVLKHYEKLAGFVPIAPTAAEEVDPKKFEEVSLPTLILYGSLDKKGEEVSNKILSLIPQSTALSLPNSGHACYLDNPRDFHLQLVKFMIKYRRRN